MLLALVAHDLKNPITVISAASRLLSQPGLLTSDEQQHQLYDQIARSSTRMHTLVTQLLDVNRVEQGAVNVNTRAVDLAEIMIKACANHSDAAQYKNIPIQCVRDSAVHCKTDPVLLQEILDNLISNAIKYSPKNTEITVHLYDSGAISVIDQGIGIALEEQAKLFRKFGKLSGQPTAGEHSTGLGLYLVKRLAELLGARIEVNSTLGKGSTFTVCLPPSSLL